MVSRIIAGRAGGRRLRTPSGRTTRPTTDRVREAVFSALAAWNGTADADPAEHLAGQSVADVFAGSGAIGLEAASRGAGPVVCIEKDARAASVIRGNAAHLALAVEVATSSAASWLATTGRRFDVMWFDPPYDLADEDLDELIDAAARVLVDNGLLVVERSARSRAPHLPEGMETWSASYGETTIHYAQWDRPTGDVAKEDDR